MERTGREKQLLAAGPARGGLGFYVDVVPLGGQRDGIFFGIVHHFLNENSKKQIKSKPEKMNGGKMNWQVHLISYSIQQSHRFKCLSSQLSQERR